MARDAISSTVKLAAALLLAAALSTHASAGPVQERQKPKPLIVLGVDGLDHGLLEQGIGEGWLPEMAAIASTGSFAPLLPTTPAESPVSWAALFTGVNPGRTGIYDFVRRVPGTYAVKLTTVNLKSWPVPLPSTGALMHRAGMMAFFAAFFALIRPRRWIGGGLLILAALHLLSAMPRSYLPDSIDFPERALREEGVWTALAKHGDRTKVLWAPLQFPPGPEPEGVSLLAGLGVPDLMGTQGTYTVLEGSAADGSRRESSTEMGGRRLPLHWRNNSGETELTGPLGSSCHVRVSRQPSGELHLWAGVRDLPLASSEWTPDIPLFFGLLPGLGVTGRSRIHVQSSGAGPPNLFLSAPAFIPGDTPRGVHISWPASFAARLEETHGPFPTLGWSAETMAVQDRVLDVAAFTGALAIDCERRQRITVAEAASRDWDVLISVLEEPDRASHMFWKAKGAAASVVADTYRWVDQTVGLLRRTRPEADLLIVSDHGFAPFETAVNLNAWLLKAGYLVTRSRGAKSGRVLKDLYEGRNLWEDIHWNRTRAFSTGLGLIHLNVRGREPRGNVAPGQPSRRLESEIRSALLELRDDQGASVVAGVSTARELYSGSHLSEAPDLVVSFTPGFRVSWQSALGGLDEPILAPNRRPWRADHCSVNPASVAGVLLSTRRMSRPPASVLDVAPTVMALRGHPIPSRLEGANLLRSP